jgi:hypothetical protein
MMNDFSLIDIPKGLYSSTTGKVFEHCLICERTLLKPDVQYIIEKAYRRGEVLYDYGMCVECYVSMMEGFSLKSRTAMDDFFDRYVDFDERGERLLSVAPGRIDPWIAQCIVSGEPIVPGDNYQIFAICQDEYVLLGLYPYAIGSATVDELYGVMSEQTKEDIDRFTRDYLRIPPEMLRDPSDLSVLV